jgi:predicted small lipoprotein YifL|tara:strand:+ start:77 stop:220 length:144 start_codon:yes stop_codon:yes gene_type:complete
MINKKKSFIMFIILLTLISCGRKGDLLPPQNFNQVLHFDFIMEENYD